MIHVDISNLIFAVPLEGAELIYRMNVNTQGVKETGKWQQGSRVRANLIVGCGLSRV